MQLCMIIYCSLTALHVSSDIFAHHQEHLNCNYSFWFYSRVSWSAVALKRRTLIVQRLNIKFYFGHPAYITTQLLITINTTNYIILRTYAATALNKYMVFFGPFQYI
jgi:hypothetical protein